MKATLAHNMMSYTSSNRTQATSPKDTMYSETHRGQCFHSVSISEELAQNL